ncbi:MAG TPA: hypothetical protein VKE69_08505 [Planctomycetota bacterium]|nr:hypothetical protein [Planctomycetota bacterium]
MKVTRFVLAFALLASPALAQVDLPDETTDSFARNDVLFDSMRSVKSHTLTAIRKRPEGFRSLPVELVIHFHETRKAGNPFFTRFTADSYIGIAAWGAEQPIWRKEEYTNDHPFFFAERRSAVIRKFLEAHTYDRIKITAVVRDIFKGVPYIEIIKAEPLDEKLDEPTIAHAARGRKMAEAGNGKAAVEEYERAFRGDIPADARPYMLVDKGEAHLAKGERDEAIDLMEDALELKPDDPSIQEALKRAKAWKPLEHAKPVGETGGEGATSRPADGAAEPAR